MPKMQYQERNDTEIESCQEGLRPLLYWVQYKCSRDGRDFLIAEGYRGEIRQNEVYIKGASNAMWPNSFHNHGAAIDVVPVVFGMPWRLKWGSGRRFKRIAGIFKECGFEWGGDWRFVDKPHFQYTQGKTINDFVNGYSINKEEYINRIDGSIDIEETKLEKALHRAKWNSKRRARIKDELAYLSEVKAKVLQ